MASTSCKSSGEPAHMGRLARFFTACIHKVWKQRSLRPKIRPLALHDIMSAGGFWAYAIRTKILCAGPYGLSTSH